MVRKADGRVVLITGASSGIGKAYALHLYQKGMKVYGTSRRGGRPWEAAVEKSTSENTHTFEMIGIDVRSDESVQKGIKYILEKFEQVYAASIENESDGAPPETVAHLLEKIINTPSPRLRYKVGPSMQKVVISLKKYCQAVCLKGSS
ncbi:MAG: SDR family NAD(P)-dependent oxidoreductase [Deltaproteobacteria bacterium]|nr:SDR family NAD(P)-dependent oxidoreductase [Deltaproteobacteria bacterium]